MTGLTIGTVEELLKQLGEGSLPHRLAEELLATMRREERLRAALSTLVELKEHKDKAGKTLWYEAEQPKALQAARDALKD